jgi:nucleoside-diphosphate-sugar epimerase
MNILITGICGFVGNNLLSSLPNHDIYGVSTSHFSKLEKAIHIYTWDELDLLPKIDVIIHLAGKAHDVKNETKASVYFDINTGLTKKIFDWFLQSSVKRFIFFSSVKAAADTVEGILTEDVMPYPKGPYGESKRAAEEYIEKNILPCRFDKQVYVLRPCMIHGPGNKGNLNLLYHIVCKGIPWPLGAFDNSRSFISIDNLHFIIERLLEQNIPSGVYNIADDEVISTNEIIRLICEVTSHNCKILNINKKMIKNMAGLGTALHLPLNQERLRKLTENYVVSNEKIKKELGIRKMPLTAREGFIKTLHSFEREKILS